MRPISDDQLRAIYASDQEIYPAPLTFDRLRSWVTAYPDLSICFYVRRQQQNTSSISSCGDITAAPKEEEEQPFGVIVVLPLLRTPHWEDLLVGKVKEIIIDAGTMFPPQPPSSMDKNDLEAAAGVEVGLHVFHIERFIDRDAVMSSDSPPPRKRFSEVAMEEVLVRVAERMRGWKICGMSALTATKAGKKTFARMGFTPTGYHEMFVPATDGDSNEGEMDMICYYPVPPTKGKERDGDQFAHTAGPAPAASEMVVKYFYGR
ncbi:hypothetical protein B0H66DRAFT_605545 [Apodospora peruviana]|uniref:Uncharacterized protein n=1 Tax=Apodospora peruviana TaxID=516989 RepID=A0AAE0M1H3_9PEZI|nr:hypothetical protein B0H66DRAFT_605545 [Apodospora peruviana]